MRRLRNDQASLWEAVLPADWALTGELAVIDRCWMMSGS
jgi:hypothetical protein